MSEPEPDHDWCEDLACPPCLARDREERREFSRHLGRQLRFLFIFVIVMLVVSPPLMVLCAYLADGQEMSVEEVERD